MAAIPTLSPARFPWRFLLYALVIFYLIADLFWLGGPLRERIDKNKAYSNYSLQRALEEGWVATVNREPISRAQLDQATAIYLFRRGKSASDLSDGWLQISRRVALQQLIDDTLVRQYAAADRFQPDPEAIDARIKAFEAQFASTEALSERLKGIGITRDQLHQRLAEEVGHRQWIEWRIAAATPVTEEDIREWFEKNAATDPGAKNPKLIRARHLFLSTVETAAPEREATIQRYHKLLSEGETTLEELATAYSEDERTKIRGGDLGWFGRNRMPEDFNKVAFALEPGAISPPFRTSLGWHVVQVIETGEAEALDFESLKPEIAAWLRTEKRRYAIEILLNRLKTVAVMEVFPDNFASGESS